MRNAVCLTVGVMVLTGLVLTGCTEATTGNGPYYATPSWDQTLPAATRFIILSNFASAAVLDKNTGLVWEKSPETTIQNWNNARFSCANRNVGGQQGWRLPSFAELSSLVDITQSNPVLPTGHPFSNVQSAGYWSATTFAGVPTAAWTVKFSSGSVIGLSKTGTLLAWCVRGPMQESVY